MKTLLAAIFVFMPFSAFANPNVPARVCRGMVQETLKLAQLSQEVADQLAQLPYEHIAVVLPNDPALQAEALRTKAEAIQSLQNFIDTQLKLSVAYRGACS